MRLQERSFSLGNLLLGLGEGSLCLGYLLIEFRGFDFSQQLPFFYLVSDVDVAFFDIACGTGIDGRFGERRDRARQSDIHVSRGQLHFCGNDAGEGVALEAGGSNCGSLSLFAGKIAQASDGCNHSNQQNDDEDDLPRRDVVLIRLFRLCTHDCGLRIISSCDSSSICSSWLMGGFLRRKL